MAFERIAEARIREHVEEGALDNLPNRGRPLDLEEYFKAPSELRMAYSILKSAGCVPEEVALMNDIAHLPDGPEKDQARLRLAVLQERNKTRPR
jgi:hypothetical protein